ncbi:MAG: gamma-glutamyltransferase family protein, partial [Conexibacter sp.]
MSGARRSEALKRPARGRRGVVVSHNVEAAEAGARVLEEGGTAIDAVVAMSLVTAARETAMSGIGGAGVMLAHVGGETIEVNAYGRTPSALPPDVFVPYLLDPAEERMEFGWRGTRGDVSQRGFLSVGVPSYLAGIATLHERLATLPWAELLAPAIALARGGFEPDEEDLTFLVAFADWVERFAEARRVFLPAGAAAAAMRPIVQEDLADTLERLAAEGAGALYRGELAERIAAHVQAGGGCLSAADMRRYEPIVGGGLRGRYRDCEVVSASGAMGGVTLIEMLNLAEELELGRLEHNSAPYLHQLAEIMRQAWTDRFVHVGDPDAPDALEDALIAKEYARTLARELPLERAAQRTRPGDPRPWAGAGAAAAALRGGPSGDVGGAHTTNVAAADADGNVATVIQTLGQCYGSCVMAPGTGTLLYDMTYWLNPAPGTPNSVGPWKRPAGHATPVVLLRDGRPLVALGAPGGRKIVTAMLQVILNMVDFGMDVQQAIAAPRIHCEGADPAAPEGPAVGTHNTTQPQKPTPTPKLPAPVPT